MAALSANVSSEIMETMTRIRSHKGVEGMMILSRDGAIIETTLSEEQTTTHGALLSSLIKKSSMIVATLDPTDELTFLRLRSKNREIMVAPDKEYLLIVIQKPNRKE